MIGESGRPEFLGKDWLTFRQGLSFSAAAPADLMDEENLQKSEWMRLACIFAQAKRGLFHNTHLLLELLSTSRDLDLRISTARILGHLAPSKIRSQISKFFLDSSYDVRKQCITSAFYACDADLIEPLLRARRALSGEEREWVVSTLSSMLEEETNENPFILDDSEFDSDEPYERCVLEVRKLVVEQVGQGCPIFNGGVLSVANVLNVMEALCSAEDVMENGGAISYVYDIFEAMTGVQSLGLFEEGVRPKPLKFLALIEEYRCNPEMQKYLPGQRYFYGNLICA